MLSPKQVVELVQDQAGYINHNYQLIDIFEGCLLKYIDQDMRDQFSLQTYLQAKHRTAPINVLPKIIDKLTNIYQTAVLRQVIEGKPADKELLAWYEDKMNVNTAMNCANELFNLCKTSLIHPYVHNGVPCLRVILNDRFVVYSDDPVNPNIPTHVILLADKYDGKDIYWVYSADGFMICNSRCELEPGLMELYGNPDGINPIGRLPFVYINESRYRLIPKQDTDVIKLTKIIPVMLSDLNLAACYQSFSIIYGLDIDDEGLKMSPNAFWKLKSDPTSDKKPEIGMLKPEVDYTQVLGLIESELSMWLGTKGIRASTVGALSADNFASGISKVIDEMDTFEARQKQVSYFVSAEQELWDLILKHMHPHWSATGMIENRAIFTPSAQVYTTFAVQLPMQSRGQLVRDVRDEFGAGFISRKRAMMKINPELTEEDVVDLMAEVDIERGIDPSAVEGSGAEPELLNGAQVESLLQVVEKIQLGILPKDSAKVILLSAFKLSEELANGIIDPIQPNSVDVSQLMAVKPNGR